MNPQIAAEWHDLLFRQSGVVSRRQAMSYGLDEDFVGRRLRSGRWQGLHRGVYATFSGPIGRDAQLWAVVLRAGAAAALSHQTAAELVGLVDERSELVQVTVSLGRHPELIQGALVRRSVRICQAAHPARLPPQTRVEETVLDLTQTASGFDEAYGWLCRAVGRRLTTTTRLRAGLDARPKVRWRAGLRLALDDIGEGAYSLLELRYVRDVERAHGLPLARRQARVVLGSRSRFLDNLYEDAKLAVELDGQVAHAIEKRWDDAHRDNIHATAGIMTLRYSYPDVTGRPCHVAAQVAAVLRARGTLVTLRRCGPRCAVSPPDTKPS